MFIVALHETLAALLRKKTIGIIKIRRELITFYCYRKVKEDIMNKLTSKLHIWL